MMNKVIETTVGIVENIEGKWVITPNENQEDIAVQKFTDRYPYDCAVIRHGSKYGLFYVSDMTPYYWGNTNPPLVSFDQEYPFPYDEIVIKSVAWNEIMLIGYRIGSKWGIDNIYYNLKDKTLGKIDLAPCSFSSLLEAENSCLSWRKPFKD